MKYVNLGQTDIKISRITLGCMSYDKIGERWHLNEQEGRKLIKSAIELGVNFFDTANVYSSGDSELVLGKAIRDFSRRENVIIATKVFFPMNDDPKTGGLSKKAIFREIDASLKRLNTDYVDLYQIHRWDYQTPIEETIEALNELVNIGKVRYLGASSMFAWQFCKSLYLADLHNWKRFISIQPHYNLLNREEEREMLPLCLAEKIAVLPWSPLARGRLARAWNAPSTSNRMESDPTGRAMYEDFETLDKYIIDQVNAVAQERSISAAQVALTWLMHQPCVTSPIIGATDIKHLKEAVDAIDIILHPKEIEKITAGYIPHPIVGYN